jgi:hypothetical protein
MAHGLRFDSLWATCWLFFALIGFTVNLHAKMTPLEAKVASNFDPSEY